MVHTNLSQLPFTRHVNDDSKYYVYTVPDERKDKKFSKLRIKLYRVLTSDAIWLGGEGLSRDKPWSAPVKREILMVSLRKKYLYFIVLEN